MSSLPRQDVPCPSLCLRELLEDKNVPDLLLLYPHLQGEVLCAVAGEVKFSTTLSKCSIMGLQGLMQGPKEWE